VRYRIVLASCVIAATASVASAQNWSGDARTIGMGGVVSNNLAAKMIAEQRDYTAIVIPIGLIQLFDNIDVFDPNSKNFNPIAAVEFGITPLHYVFGRSDRDSAESLFITDIRNATLSTDLTKYKGFAPANNILAEGLAAPSWGATIKVRKDPMGGFQGFYVGAGPYLSMHSLGTIDQGLTDVLATGVNKPNAEFPLTDSSEGQIALAITGGYRGRFAWPMGIGTGSPREGIYVAANYNYLHGFRYENIDMAMKVDTNSAGLVTVKPGTTPLVIDRQDGTDGHGFALDLGVGAVVQNWEFGFGANGIANRIDWSGVSGTRYSLPSLTSGNSNFIETPIVAPPTTRVELPVDVRGTVAYSNDMWTAAVEAGHGFGGGSFHGGVERRFGRFEARGGARYTVQKWNPTGGVGVNLTPRVGFDVAAFGTTANLEQKRELAIAASIRINHLP